jgi:hypothetical protein
VALGWFEVDPVVFGLALSLLIQLGSIFQWYVLRISTVHTSHHYAFSETNYQLILGQSVSRRR